MKYFIVRVSFEPLKYFDSGVLKVRVTASNAERAKHMVLNAGAFPYNGKITSVKEAAYKRKTNQQ